MSLEDASLPSPYGDALAKHSPLMTSGQLRLGEGRSTVGHPLRFAYTRPPRFAKGRKYRVFAKVSFWIGVPSAEVPAFAAMTASYSVAEIPAMSSSIFFKRK